VQLERFAPVYRSCLYVPITQDGKVVDSQGYVYEPEGDRDRTMRPRKTFYIPVSSETRKLALGEKLPSQVFTSLLRCPAGKCSMVA